MGRGRGVARGLLGGIGLALATAALAVEDGARRESAPAVEDGAPPEGARAVEDGAPPEGATLGWTELLALRELLPPEIWRHRDRFFHPDMRMRIGPARRLYTPPRSFAEATARNAGRARLDADGNLHGHTPGEGLPFPPETIDPAAPDAALRWAWNLARRHRGAGPRGRFRLVDLPENRGAARTTTGEWFQLVPGGADSSFVAGGRFHEPAPVRHLAWRQRRPREASLEASLPDETFVYLPGARKVRRAAGGWVDGLFAPNYRSPSAPGAPGGAGGGRGIAATEPLRRGWLGLALRPNAYRWRWLGEREVLAPLNAARAGYPLAPGRSWGPSGLSAADDRWERRRAVVIQGALREPGQGFATLTLYVDAQTQQPLYLATRDGAGRLVETGILLHRYSDDLEGYPPGAGGERASVFDPVAAVFVEPRGGSGWRRESYDALSSPPHDAELQRLTGPGFLDRGR